MIKVEEKKDATEALLVQMGKQRAEAEEQQAIATAEAAKASKCVARDGAAAAPQIVVVCAQGVSGGREDRGRGQR